MQVILRFYYSLLPFEGGDNSLRAGIMGMHLTSWVMLISPILLLYFCWKGEELSAALFLFIFFHGSNDPSDFSGVPLLLSLPKSYLHLVKSTDFRQKTGRHQQTLSKLPKLVLGTEGGLSYMSLDLWHSCAKDEFCNEANNWVRIALQRDYSF